MWAIQERQSVWAIVDEYDIDIFYVDIRGQKDCGNATSRGFSEEELADRAALCAAAPEMLSALRLAKEALDFDRKHSSPRITDQAFLVVKEAIAKAIARPTRS